MEKVKMQYIGRVPTRVLTQYGGAKVDVEVDEIVEMDKEIAEDVARSYKGVWVTPEQADAIKAHREEAEANKADHNKVLEKEKKDAEKSAKKEPKKDAGEVEGGLDESKVQTAVPTNDKKGKK